jgi:hypothetical protein
MEALRLAGCKEIHAACIEGEEAVVAVIAGLAIVACNLKMTAPNSNKTLRWVLSLVTAIKTQHST